MKKELNAKSRRKFVVGGAMVFGSIALLSTGFATWVIGATVDNQDQGISVGLEEIQNQSYLLTAKVVEGSDNNTTLTIGDTVSTTSGFVTNTDHDGDFVVDVELTVNTTADRLPSETLVVGIKDGHNSVAKDALSPTFAHLREEKDSYNILKLAETSYDLTWGEPTTNSSDESVKTYVAKATLEFALDEVWKTEGATTIAGFYNKHYTSSRYQPVVGEEDLKEWDAASIKTALGEINKELRAVESALEGFTVTLQVAPRAAI